MNGRKRHLLLGITGSVAAIRAPMIVEELSSFAEIKVLATASATHFIKSLSHVTSFHLDADEWTGWSQLGDPVLHIELRRWADVFLIAPLSANSLGKLAHGLCDNLLLSVARAWDFDKPIVVAPAMNTAMWNHPTTEEHLTKIRSWGIDVIEPIEKKLACEDVGMGAMALPATISERVRAKLNS